MTTQSRLVRVFISSTFADFIEERDELVKKVFPELRKRCRQRFVELLEVDLRWGITEEQSKSGETLRICLEEIDRCRPSSPVFFVGLMGERYGWVPPQEYFNHGGLDDLRFQWVTEHIQGTSMTELEVLYGVLRNKKMHDNAFFYFRNDGYEERHWEEILQYHQRMGQHIKKNNFTNGNSPTPELDAEKQINLKLRVRAASLRWEPKEYETPVDMATILLEDLWQAIDEVFPASSVPESLERESIEHRVFMESRTRAYFELQGIYDSLDAFVGLPLEEDDGDTDGNSAKTKASPDSGSGGMHGHPQVRVVLGESGSGKSALLAAWLVRQERQGNPCVFFHFAGASAASVSASSMLRRLLATLRKRGVVSVTESVPETDVAMAKILPQWLDRLSEQGGGILLFDAVNQLDATHDGELWWWPCEWPKNIRVIFSTLPGASLREMERRGWTAPELVETILPLQKGEIRSIINLYLNRFARALEVRLQEQIVAAPQAANPLFLRTLLDELRIRSQHDNLEVNLQTMLGCADPAALFVDVLKNMERDFTPPEHPSLIHRALGLMGVALRGLSEDEMLQLLSPSETPASDPLPRHYWAPLYLALEDSLVSRDGQLSFFHDYLRQAVWREYLDEENELETSHARLAETATRWREDRAFGASLRAYGFENGIRHLINCRRTEEAQKLLLDQEYRETAARTLRQVRPVLLDVARVRLEVAQQTAYDPAQAAALTVLSLTGERQLTDHLRQTLDKCAKQGDWEDVLALSAAEDEVSMRLLLACRALIVGGSKQISVAAAAALRNVMERWAKSTGKPEWEELVRSVLPLHESQAIPEEA